MGKPAPDGAELGRLPRESFRIYVTGSVGAAGARVFLRALAGDDPKTVSGPDGVSTVVPNLTAAANVTVAPTGPAAFGVGATVGLVLQPHNLDTGKIGFAELKPVDVVGLGSADLLTITPVENSFCVRHLPVAATGGEVLSPLTIESRRLARHHLGSVQRSKGSTPTVVIAVDASASMRLWAANGLLAAIIDVIVGVVLATWPECKSLRGALLGKQLTWVESTQPDAMSRVLSTRLSESPGLIGAKLATPELGEKTQPGAQQLFLITDGLPGDLEAIQRQANGGDWHLVVLANNGGEIIREPLKSTWVDPARFPKDPADIAATSPGLLAGAVRSLTAARTGVDLPRQQEARQ